MGKFPGITGLFFDEDLLIKQSSKGVCGIGIPNCGLNASELRKTAASYINKKFIRKKAPKLPEVSEPAVVRHFVRLSSWNMSADSTFYPLGSCTMKYNPKINELIGALDNIKNLHPLTPSRFVQPVLKIIHDFHLILCELTGLDEFSFSPQAGAAGEFTGLKVIKKYFDVKGEKRDVILIPDSAHGTNPASAALAGFSAVEIKTGPNGYIGLKDVEEHLSKNVAAIMITNPNTLGIFETDIKKISEIMHKNGSLVYMDGANFNAFIGNIRVSEMGIDLIQLNLHKTFSTPHGGGGPGSGAVGVKGFLGDYLPVPYVSLNGNDYKISKDKLHTIGRIAPFLCNFAVILKAYAYLLSLGNNNISSVSEIAILNANYIKKQLNRILAGADPFEGKLCMHESVFTDKAIEKRGISTLDFAKLLIDYGFHPPTVYFPKNIHGAIMIEPTETESIKTMDIFLRAIEKIASKTKKSVAQKSPCKTKVRRVNELLANKYPVFKY